MPAASGSYSHCPLAPLHVPTAAWHGPGGVEQSPHSAVVDSDASVDADGPDDVALALPPSVANPTQSPARSSPAAGPNRWPDSHASSGYTHHPDA